MWHCTGLMSHLDNFVPPIVQLSAINGGAARLHSDAGLKDCREPPTQKGCAVCFIHSDSHVSRRQFIEQFSLGAAAAAGPPPPPPQPAGGARARRRPRPGRPRPPPVPTRNSSKP